MRVLVEYTIGGQYRVEQLQEVGFLPRVGEIIAMVKISGGCLEVQEVHHAFGPDNGDHLVRLVSKYIPDKK